MTDMVWCSGSLRTISGSTPEGVLYFLGECSLAWWACSTATASSTWTHTQRGERELGRRGDRDVRGLNLDKTVYGSPTATPSLVQPEDRTGGIP